jgi:hypothetical protein
LLPVSTICNDMFCCIFNWKFQISTWLFLIRKMCNFVYITAFTVNSRSSFLIWRHQNIIKIHCITHAKENYCLHCTSRHNTVDKVLIISHPSY